MKKFEARMFYGDYKKIKGMLQAAKYDETTKEAVFYLSNCKQYTIEAKGEEFIFLVANGHDYRFPNAPAIEHVFMADKDSGRREIINHSFNKRLYEGTVQDWKFFKEVKGLTGKEFLQELKNSRIY